MQKIVFSKILLALFFLGVFSVSTSCKKDDDPVLASTISKSFSNLSATQSTDYTTNPPTVNGDFIKFSFSKGTTVNDDTWDIAFRGTAIIINGGTASSSDQPNRTGKGGAYVTTGTLSSIKEVVEASLKQDATATLAIPTGSDNGWYNYAGPPTHLITPIAGKIIVVKTHDGHYAKMEILSYYKDGSPAADGSNSQHYTFNYVYQPNQGVKTFGE
jgi:hypothetical protein